MGRISRRTKLCFCLAAIMFLLFALGESQMGQRYLIGSIPKSSGNQAADAFAADDREMGAGLTPIAFCLLPAGLLTICGLFFCALDWRRKNLQEAR